MFRIQDIQHIAIQIEKNGEATYRKAGQLVEDPELKEMLLWMADEELRHRKWFEQLVPEMVDSEPQDDLEAMGKSLLEKMVADQTFSLDQESLQQASSVCELLVQSQTFEEDTVLFYEFLRDLLDDEQAIAHLNRIIEEERSHAKQLASMAETCT